MQLTTAEKVIEQLDEKFSRHGFPVTIKLDNGPQLYPKSFIKIVSQTASFTTK